MRRALPILAAIALTAVVTYLAVSNRQYRDHAARLADDLSNAETRNSELEQELRQTRQQLRKAQNPPIPPRPLIVADQSQHEAVVAVSSSNSQSTDLRLSASPLLATLASEVVPVPLVMQPFASPSTTEWVRYEPVPGESKCTVEGTTTLYEWSLQSPVIAGSLAVDSRYDLYDVVARGQVDETNVPARGTVSIPVRSLKSYKQTMDRVVQERLNESRHPRIEYRLSRLSFRFSTNGATAALFDSAGELVINGVTNVVQMPVTVERTRTDVLRVSGSKALKMTDFKIQPPMPPSADRNNIASNDIKVSFVWGLARAPAGR